MTRPSTGDAWALGVPTARALVLIVSALLAGRAAGGKSLDAQPAETRAH